MKTSVNELQEPIRKLFHVKHGKLLNDLRVSYNLIYTDLLEMLKNILIKIENFDPLKHEVNFSTYPHLPSIFKNNKHLNYSLFFYPELKETKEVLNFINELEDYIASYENTLKRQDNNSVFYEIKLLINLLKFKYTTSQGEYLKFRKIFFLVNGMDTFISMQEKLDAELNYVKYLKHLQSGEMLDKFKKLQTNFKNLVNEYKQLQKIELKEQNNTIVSKIIKESFKKEFINESKKSPIYDFKIRRLLNTKYYSIVEHLIEEYKKIIKDNIIFLKNEIEVCATKNEWFRAKAIHFLKEFSSVVNIYDKSILLIAHIEQLIAHAGGNSKHVNHIGNDKNLLEMLWLIKHILQLQNDLKFKKGCLDDMLLVVDNDETVEYNDEEYNNVIVSVKEKLLEKELYNFKEIQKELMEKSDKLSKK
jgi:hypothetical protein